MMARTRILQTRLSDPELEHVEAAARAQGTTVAALLRAGVLAYIGANGAPSVHERLRILEEQVHELRSRR
jgi:hypothetical protein